MSETVIKRPRVSHTRDFPPGCGSHRTNFKTFKGFTRDYPPGCGPHIPKRPQLCPTSGSRPRIMMGDHSTSDNSVGPTVGGEEGSTPRRIRVTIGGCGVQQNRSPKVKLYDPLAESRPSGTQVEKGKGKGMISESRRKEEGTVSMSKEREMVLEMLRVFRERCEVLGRKGVKRVDIDAKRELDNERRLIPMCALRFGSVPGVEIGDQFFYRVELVIVGLHRLFQGGIDSMEYGGDRYATCIVANEGHMDNMSDPDVLSYIGEGGTLKKNEVGVPPDQQLVGGNLALNNSKKDKKPVRVVRGLRYGASNAKIVYVYDGLYEVTDAIKKKGPQRNMIFDFRLTRMAGQRPVPWNEYRRVYR